MNERLIILMRTDMDSMNPGKAIAQGAHAAQVFTNRMKAKDTAVAYREAYDNWKCQAPQGYGTVITLGVPSLSAMAQAVEHLQSRKVPAELIIDPTYPLKDGSFLHLIPCTTCAFVFQTAKNWDIVSNALKSLDLHP